MSHKEDPKPGAGALPHLWGPKYAKMGEFFVKKNIVFKQFEKTKKKHGAHGNFWPNKCETDLNWKVMKETKQTLVQSIKFI